MNLFRVSGLGFSVSLWGIHGGSRVVENGVGAVVIVVRHWVPGFRGVVVRKVICSLRFDHSYSFVVIGFRVTWRNFETWRIGFSPSMQPLSRKLSTQKSPLNPKP